MKNRFDCVVMKHKGAEKVLEKISGLTLTEELRFWQERASALRKQKEALLNKQNEQVVSV